MSGYKAWEKEFDGQIQLSVKASTEVFQKAGRDLYTLIQNKTPIGDPSLWKWPAHKNYTPGTLRAAWQIDSTVNKITISNDTPYGYRVEYGSWSTQAPQGMMRISVLEFPKILDQASKVTK